MKRILTFLFAVFLFSQVFAQSMPKFSYQAVIRNALNELVTNDSVWVRIHFYNHDISGSAVYSESHRVISNQNGLISLLVGEGEDPVGDLSQVTWSDAVVRTEITLRGGHTVSDVKPVTAVPFAYYAEQIPLQALEEHLGSTNLVSADALRDTLAHYITISGLTDTLTNYVTRPEMSDYVTTAALSDSLSHYNSADPGLLDTLANYVTAQGLTDTLTNYVTRPELSNTLSNYVPTSELSGYVTTSGLTDTLANYVTRGELSGYVTRPEMSDYVTTAALSDSLSHYNSADPGLLDTLANFVTTTELSGILANYVTAADLEEALGDLRAALADLRSITAVLEEFIVPETPTNVFRLSATPVSGMTPILYINGVCVSSNAYRLSDNMLIYQLYNNGGKSLVAGDRVQFYYYHK